MTRRMLGGLIAIAVVAFGGEALAQQAAGGGGATRTQEFNFNDELVQGQLVRPDGDATRLRARQRGISLIRLREHFVPEMLKSVENL